MLQAIVYGAGDLRLVEKPLDAQSLEASEVYVQTEVTALSTGTELGVYLGNSVDIPGAPDYPRAIGYSNVGIVRQVGAGVTRLSEGQRVFSTRPHQSAYIGRASELVCVPGNVAPEVAALAYLTNLGVVALRQANYQSGENVVVIGLGIIGLCAVAVARVMGARVWGIANSPERAAIAARLGARSEPADAADVVILTANSWAAFRKSVDLARDGGRISILGFPGRGQPAPDFNPLSPEWLYAKQLTLIGAGRCSRVECDASDIRFNLRRNLEMILGWMSDGALCLAPAITYRLPACHMREAYELAKEHSKALAGAVFDWRGVL